MLCLAFASLAGCSIVGTALNPYEDDFHCKLNPGSEIDGGICSGVSEVYKDALEDREYKSDKTRKKEAKEAKNAQSRDSEENISPARLSRAEIAAAESKYQKARLERMTGLIEAPVTPLVAPPVVMRLLILPYEDEDNGLNLMRYTYLMLDRPRWVMGDYLYDEREELY